MLLYMAIRERKMPRKPFFLKRLFAGDDSHEFKPIFTEIIDRPVNPLGRSIFWVVVVLFIISLFWVFIGRVDIVITARGKVIPQGKVKLIQSLDKGVVKHIFIKEGDFVKKGQTLMEIDAVVTQAELKALKSQSQQLRLDMRRLRSLSEHKPFLIKNDDDIAARAAKIQSDTYSAAFKTYHSQLELRALEHHKIDEKIKVVLAKNIISSAY